jgi:stage III sporulation protein AG
MSHEPRRGGGGLRIWSLPWPPWGSRGRWDRPAPTPSPASRRLRLLLALGAAAVALLIGTGLWAPAASPAPPRVAPPSPYPPSAPGIQDFAVLAQASDPLVAYERRLDRLVAGVLSQVAGAGPVQVAVTVAGAPTVHLARQGTVRSSRQTDRSGVRESRSSQLRVVTGPHQGGAVVTGEAAPRVIGVLVVAPGAQNPWIRQELTQGVETLFGLSASQVLVLPGQGPRRGG